MGKCCNYIIISKIKIKKEPPNRFIQQFRFFFFTSCLDCVLFSSKNLITSGIQNKILCSGFWIWFKKFMCSCALSKVQWRDFLLFCRLQELAWFLWKPIRLFCFVLVWRCFLPGSMRTNQNLSQHWWFIAFTRNSQSTNILTKCGNCFQFHISHKWLLKWTEMGVPQNKAIGQHEFFPSLVRNALISMPSTY